MNGLRPGKIGSAFHRVNIPKGGRGKIHDCRLIGKIQKASIGETFTFFFYFDACGLKAKSEW